MTVRRLSSGPASKHPRRLDLVTLGLALGGLAVGGTGVALITGPGSPDVPTPPAPVLDRASAVDAAVGLVVEAGAAGARSTTALRAVQRRRFATTVETGLTALTLRASDQQRRALLRGTPAGTALLERTVPVGYQLTKFDGQSATVAVWTVNVAGPDRGRRLPGGWWLTTRVDLVPEQGAWRAQNAVAVQGPTPRLVRAQQAGVGVPAELRGMLRTSRGFSDAP